MSKFDARIYREIDGFFYYDPTPHGGSYDAHTLREIADILDAKNKDWSEEINRELTRLENENQTAQRQLNCKANPEGEDRDDRTPGVVG